MIVKDICDIIEKRAPLDSALGFDNVGLLIGDYGAHVKGAVIAVDVTPKTIDKALECGANMIIAHHPLIFNPIKRLVKGDYVSETVSKAISGNINVYACHTNADNAPDGLNYSLLKKLGADSIQTLCDDGTGCFGITNCDIDELISRTKTIVKGFIKTNIYAAKKNIYKAALVTGCGGRDEEIVKRIEEIGADCYLTAEVAHHIRLEFIDKGINLIEFGHYESERIFIEVMENWLDGVEIETFADYNEKFEN